VCSNAVQSVSQIIGSLERKVLGNIFCLVQVYSNWLRVGRSGDRIPVGARFSAPVQTGPRAHPASCTMGTGFFLGVKSGRGVTLTPHPLLVPWSRKGRAIPLLPLWVAGLYRASVPVQVNSGETQA